MKKRKDATGRTTKVIAIRVPVELSDRLHILATKRLISLNAWCSNALAKAARPKQSPHS